MAKTKRPTPNRRKKVKYPALDPRFNLKTRWDLLDYDYISKLSDTDKAWLNKFSEEYNNASMNSKKPEKNLHNTQALRKDCYDRNNARNRDILTRAKAQGLVREWEALEYETLEIVNEDSLIDYIDSQDEDDFT